MSKLNKDILFLIFEELQDDSKSLFSCLMVNRTWCEIVIPILWRNPWCYDIKYYNKSYLFAIIVSYLSDDIKESLTKQGSQLPLVSYQPLYEEISRVKVFEYEIY
uniref:F-box domain-containing protein n=1 Tax=Rhizophagus irregularis (strain DAOM 181602 / DAOM 197198 / MUCL 43194) TaxID=747089 RepID=U9T5V4_RHIID